MHAANFKEKSIYHIISIEQRAKHIAAHKKEIISRNRAIKFQGVE